MNQLSLFLPLLVVLAVFMFFGSRRQKKTVQHTIDLQESLRIGDQVHTTSGLRGTITDITDDYVDLAIAPGVVTSWMKLAIRDRIEPETFDAEVVEAGEAGEAEEPGSDDLEFTAEPDRLPAGDSKRLPKD